MKLSEIIKNIDKTQDSYVDLSDICSSLGLDLWKVDDDAVQLRLKAYWIVRWLCTDTWVGMQAFFLDDEWVAIWQQAARKNDAYISYVSTDAKEKVRKLILDCSRKSKDDDNDIMSQDDIHEELGDGYTRDYTSEILHYKGLYNGEAVDIGRERIDHNLPTEEWSRVNITHADGRVERVELADLILPFIMKGNEHFYTRS